MSEKSHVDYPILTKVVRLLQWPFDNPANAEGSIEERLDAFQMVRDQMRPVFEAYAAGNKDGVRGRQEQAAISKVAFGAKSPSSLATSKAYDLPDEGQQPPAFRNFDARLASL